MYLKTKRSTLVIVRVLVRVILLLIRLKRAVAVESVQARASRLAARIGHSRDRLVDRVRVELGQIVQEIEIARVYDIGRRNELNRLLIRREHGLRRGQKGHAARRRRASRRARRGARRERRIVQQAHAPAGVAALVRVFRVLRRLLLLLLRRVRVGARRAHFFARHVAFVRAVAGLG